MKLYSAHGTCATAMHISLEWIGEPYEVKPKTPKNGLVFADTISLLSSIFTLFFRKKFPVKSSRETFCKLLICQVYLALSTPILAITTEFPC
jgi:hypothetical protein